MKKLIIFLTGVIPLLIASCSDDNTEGNGNKGDDNETYTPVALSPNQTAMSQTAVDFSHSFFAAYDAIEKDNNYIISPLSLEYALAMIANGTDGQTLSQLLNVMGYENSDLQDLNEFCRLLMKEIPNVSNRSLMSVYNNMWYNTNVSSDIYPDFSNALQNYFEAGCIPSNPENILGKINDWVSQKTDGRIKKCLDDISPNYHNVITNVLKFEGFWPKKLDTQNYKFHNADGTDVEKVFLVAKNSIITHHTEMGNIFDISYSQGAYRFRIIFPNEDVALDDFIANFSEQYKNAEHWKDVPTTVNFPKFKISSNKSLKDALTGMGVTDIFDETSPKILKISSTPSFLSDILQVGSIEVDENGTVAVAVTVGPPPVGAQPSFIYETINRPFGFEIYESSTGTILFQGRVNNL